MIILQIILAVSASMGVATGARLIMLLRRFTRSTIPELPTDETKLPTVSVCIPARNETHAMTQCLERVISSRYPKLEIIVLDDSSVDNTSVLIKSFAHSGVRFVEGSPLPDGWLGKNHALHELYKEASGELILFLDVDTHLASQSVESMVAIATNENAHMVSVLPAREDMWRGSVLFATLRNFWSVVAHTKARPASTSSAWLVSKEFLQQEFSGLERLQHTVLPERNVAALAASRSAYRFLISTDALRVTYEKKWSSQCQTSIRLLYPFFGGSIVKAFCGLLMLLTALLPFVIVPTVILYGWHPTHTVALISAIIYVLLYVIYVSKVWKSGWLIGGLLFPFILAQECILLVISIYEYSTRTVTWKGRPITRSAKAVINPNRSTT